MERYSEYKDSGVLWLGEIPGHWGCVQNRFIFKENIRFPQENDTPLSLSQVDGLIPTDDMKESSLKTSSYDNWKRVHIDDIVLNRFKAHLGVLFASKYIGMVSFHYGVFEMIRPIIPKYYEYMFHSDQFRLILGFASKGMTVGLQNLGNADFYNLKSLYPPIEEQHSIVSFLDDKCGKIDKMLGGKQKQIELLAEMKQRIIADAVTRGLNPDVKMKATNIPWLSEIPEHWEEQRMATLFTGDIEVNKDFEYKRAFKFNYGQLVPKNEIGEPEDYREVYVKYSKIKQGDILVNGLNLNYDFISQRVACAPSDGIITSAYVVCRPRKDVNYEYYTYLFKGMDSMKLFHGMGTGIRLTLSFKEMKKQILPIPPHSEQHDIVSYIKERSAKIDTLTSKLQQEIESIKEYKQRLISDVVTGQIKVC